MKQQVEELGYKSTPILHLKTLSEVGVFTNRKPIILSYNKRSICGPDLGRILRLYESRKPEEMEEENAKEENRTAAKKKVKIKKFKTLEERNKWFKKSDKIGVRFSYEELEQIEKEVDKLGIDRAKYVKTKFKSGKIRVLYIDQTFEKLHYELNKIGNNLNQIARHINEENGANIASNFGFVQQGLDDLKRVIQLIETEIDKQKGS